MKTQTNFTLDCEVYEKFQKWCKTKNLKMSPLVNEMIKQAMAKAEA